MVSMIRHWDVLGNDGAVIQPTWLNSCIQAGMMGFIWLAEQSS